jgi:putative peptide zinc metalloprotease protein
LPTVSFTASGPASDAVPGFDVWKTLADRLDPTTFRPKLAPGVEWKLFTFRWGEDYVVAASPQHDVHFQLPAWSAGALPLMDGSRTVAELLVERLDEAGGLDADSLVQLVGTLREGGLLDPRSLDVAAAVERALDPARGRRGKFLTFVKTLKVEWSGADRLVRRLYRSGFRLCFRPLVAAAGAAIALGGLAAFFEIVRWHRYRLGAQSPPLESIVLIALTLVLIAAHELGHALVQVHDGRPIRDAGFMIYLGAPSFFVDSSDGMLMDRGMRIMQSAAGPAAELVVAGIASLAIFFFPGSAAAPLLYRFALLNLFFTFLNLMPLLELDGYWIFSDLIQMPDLRPRSLVFVQHDLWHKLRVREHLNLQEWGLAFYGLVGVAFTVGSLFVSYYFWQHLFGGLVSALWSGGPVSRILLVLLTLFLLGPLIRGAFALGTSVTKRVRATVRRVRFRLQTKWRVEAAEMIDALPAFEDLPERLLGDLAGRVNLRVVRGGQPVFRQGDRATAFYVVRSGTIRIEVEHPDTGDTQVLSVLTKGDSFGELGLLQMTPRSATARATVESQLFEVDKGTFDRLLAGAMDVPAFALTLQSMAELRDLPAFAHLNSEGLSELLRLGSWVSVPPGETLVRQGDEGDAFYAIRSGRADVVRDDERIADLGPGDHFGEAALLNDAPRNATVAAHTPLRAFRLTREGFDELIAGAFRRKVVLPPADRDMEH